MCQTNCVDLLNAVKIMVLSLSRTEVWSSVRDDALIFNYVAIAFTSRNSCMQCAEQHVTM